MKNTEPAFIRDMFDSIAPRYDLLNRLLSMRQDVYWRRLMVSVTDIPLSGIVLDAACGTGDVAIEFIRQKGPDVTVIGIDFSPGMLGLARDKIRKSRVSLQKLHLIAGDVFHLPFRDKTFDAVTIAFGIRNIRDRLSVLKRFYRCIKPGGVLLILELTTPPKGSVLSLFYLFYFKKILPLIGRFVSKDPKAYNYLPVSVAAFPESDIFARTISEAGFTYVKWRKLTLGIATLYVGER